MDEAIIALVTAFIGGMFKFAHDWAKARLTPSRLSTVSQLARIATEAVDEVSRATDGISPGEKFRIAEDFLRTSAKRVGVKLTNEEASAFIHSVLNGRRNEVEAAVQEALNQVFLSLPEDVPADTEVE